MFGVVVSGFSFNRRFNPIVNNKALTPIRPYPQALVLLLVEALQNPIGSSYHTLKPSQNVM